MKPENSRQAASVMEEVLFFLSSAQDNFDQLKDVRGMAGKVHSEFRYKLAELIRGMTSALSDLEHEAEEEEFGPDEKPYTQADFLGDGR